MSHHSSPQWASYRSAQKMKKKTITKKPSYIIKGWSVSSVKVLQTMRYWKIKLKLSRKKIVC